MAMVDFYGIGFYKITQSKLILTAF